MAKPYILFKASSGIYYAQLRLPDGTRANNKSTGSYNRADAEKIVMNWLVNGNIPARINSKNNDRTTVDVLNFFNSLRTYNFSGDNIKEIVKILRERKFIQSAIITKTLESRPIDEFLEEFWDMEKSPYISEKKIKGQEIHMHYVATQVGRIRKYWIPRLEGKSVGEITREDINSIFEDEDIMKLAPKTVNAIINAITLPMKWAFFHNLTEINCYDGIIKCSNKVEKRNILTIEETKVLFGEDWENDSAKLACLLACYTGMREGEIAALRLQDIGKDRIFIRHSWSKYEGLKTTKTEEEREIIIPPQLRDMLLAQADFNPFNEGQTGFVFFGLLPSQPTDPKNWLKYMRRALEKTGYENPDKVCFHSFRHEWCTTALSEIGDKRICMVGSGHKTDSVFASYSAHIEKEKALERIAQATEKVFLPIVESAEKVEYTIHDEVKQIELV